MSDELEPWYERKPLRLDVVGFSEEVNAHICSPISPPTKVNTRHFVDLYVSGDIDPAVDPQELVGKSVFCEYVHPYIAIASGVRIESAYVPLISEDEDENTANARLIAAAPEMYEMLKRLEWIADEFGYACRICHSPTHERPYGGFDDGEEFYHARDCKLAALLRRIEGGE